MNRRTIQLLLFLVFLCLIWLMGPPELRASAVGVAERSTSVSLIFIDCEKCQENCSAAYQTCLAENPEVDCRERLVQCVHGCFQTVCRVQDPPGGSSGFYEKR
jgi:hypothetical protein